MRTWSLQSEVCNVKTLGFKMGHRKLIMKWIMEQKHSGIPPTVTAATAVPPTITVATAVNVPSPSSSLNTTSSDRIFPVRFTDHLLLFSTLLTDI